MHPRVRKANLAEIILRCCTEVAFAGRLFLFWTTGLDGNDSQHTTLDAKLAAIIAPRLEMMGFELVRVAVLGREKPTVQVMADRADGSQITVEDCEQISHDVSAAIDVDDPIPGAWTLEVSSAGIDRPLTRISDFTRWKGHEAKIELTAPLDGRKRFRGRLDGLDGNDVIITSQNQRIQFPFRTILEAKLVLTDKLIQEDLKARKNAQQEN